MPLIIVKNDITKMQVDAIVNAANTSLLGGGGVDGCIHRVAGRELLEECKTLGGCETGDAKITKGYMLPCRNVIHAVGPRWRGGQRGEEEKLVSCYRRSLSLAKEYGCQSIAFPLISAGVYAYPKTQALQVAVKTIGEFLSENEMTVYIVIFDKASFQIDKKLSEDIQLFLEYNYTEKLSASSESSHRKTRPYMDMVCGSPFPAAAQSDIDGLAQINGASLNQAELDRLMRGIDESFSQMLLRKIDERGISDVACYKKANIDRKLFSKIRGDTNYKPSKTTAIAFALALELPMEETEELLKKAGYALSGSSKFDVIITYFIRSGNYDVFEINQALFAFDQSLLGA